MICTRSTHLRWVIYTFAKNLANMLSYNYFVSDEHISIIFMFFIALRGFCASFMPSYAAHPTLPIYFGSFFQMMNVHPFHIEFLFLLWSSNYLANILVAWKFKVQDFAWIEIIRYFEGYVSAKKIGLSEQEGHSLRKRAQLILKIVHISALSVVNNSMILFAMFCYIKYYPHFEFLFFNLIWFLLYTNFTVQLTYMIYMNAAYLYLMCTLVRMKFKRLQHYLSSFENFKNRSGNFR